MTSATRTRPNAGAAFAVALYGAWAVVGLWGTGPAAARPRLASLRVVHAFGALVPFTTPYVYKGGDLLLTIRHTGNAFTSGFLDTLATARGTLAATTRQPMPRAKPLRVGQIVVVDVSRCAAAPEEQQLVAADVPDQSFDAIVQRDAPDANRGPVGRLTLGPSIEAALDAAEAALPPTPLAVELVENLRTDWAPGPTPAAFGASGATGKTHDWRVSRALVEAHFAQPGAETPVDKALRDYLWERQLESLRPNGPVLLSWMIMLHLPIPGAGPRWLRDRTREQFNNLPSFLAHGPWPLCLIGSSTSPWRSGVTAMEYRRASAVRPWNRTRA